MILVAIVGAILFTLFLSAFYSGAETGLYCANRVRLHLAAQQRDPRGLRLANVFSDERGALIALLIGVNLMDFLTTNLAAYLFDDVLRLSDREVELFTVGLIAPLTFVFANVVPKNLFQLHADRLMLLGSRLLHLSCNVFRMTGAIWFLRTLADWVNRWTADPAAEPEGYDPKWKVAVLLQESLAGKAHSSDQTAMIDRVLQLSEMSLQSVMVSAGRMTAIPSTTTRDELIRLVRGVSYARLPVYGSSRRHIIGIAQVDTLLGSEDWTIVGQRMDPVLRMGPYDTVATAISIFQTGGRRMAVVAEENGPVLGIVTLQTLLELVVGGLALGD